MGESAIQMLLRVGVVSYEPLEGSSQLLHRGKGSDRYKKCVRSKL
jgi:hypothetical protein